MQITTINHNKKRQKTRAIGDRLKRAKTYQKQEEILLDWSNNWRNDQENTIYKLRQAAWANDHGEIMHMIDQLIGMTEKRFGALDNVIRKVSDPNRKLEDLDDTQKSQFKRENYYGNKTEL